MTRIFELRRDKACWERFNGSLDAAHKWGLPGARCSTCGATWSSSGHQYPAIDLSQLPERSEFEKPRPEPFTEFARLRELVRPLAPPNAALPPGTSFGPLVGTASGKFAPFTWLGDIMLLVRREELERLQAEGVRGLLGCRTELAFRQKNPPELLELQLEPHGRLHPDCLPTDLLPPCATCGRVAFRLPEQPILEAASLPTDLDVFRVGSYATVIVGTQRFMEAVRHLALEGTTFRELPTR
ncbi:SitI6 family double-CXXCG motif immunity protein [Pyxidicoccus xibeiensis]|uniref:SitI6 family double-CXXCG motif immunity protein n=1 Tax=Pyxidicoccus xibeiensis TaxID=2906759 RepID=UPI0020A7786F|nr:double-CXXCG motif protein [Pyxidicoccus xibeiensis]MCP3145123.1 double-CXXCG motif protein [Pyxidicoccus xibeiensis]